VQIFDRVFDRDDILLSVSFKWSIIAAIVVDLPLPAAPVTMIKPRGLRINSLQISGNCIWSMVG